MIARLFRTENPRTTAYYMALICLPVLLFFAQLSFVLSAAHAHAGPDYCGHSERWITVDGKLHRQVFVSELSGGDHRYKGAHYIYSGTGYVRTTAWDYARATNCH